MQRTQKPEHQRGYGHRRSSRRRVVRLLRRGLLLLFMPVLIFSATIHGLLRGIARLAGRWWKSASFQHLLRGIPALATLIFVVYLILVIQATPRSELVAAYGEAANEAFADGDFQAATVYYERLSTLDGERDETLARLAVTAQRLGDEDRVMVLLDRLAPLERPVHGPAHLWKAQLLLLRPLDFETLVLAETQLLHALRADPNTPETHALLGRIYMMLGQSEDAVEHLTAAVKDLPQYTLTLARACTLTGEIEKAERYGTAAQTMYREATEDDPTNVEHRIQWAEATTFLEQFPEAVRILQQGIALSDDHRCRQALAAVCVAWSDALERQDVVDRSRQFRLLAEGLKANPHEPALFHRILLVLRQAEQQTAGTARDFLHSMLVNGEATALVHLLLATDAGDRGEDQAAIHHLELAWELDPSMTVAANNLAWHLARQDPPDLEAALSLVDALAERWPDVGHFRDTRGQIYAKMGRWKEALVDLEAALPELVDYRPLHVTIAQVYSELGMEELAAKHRETAESLPDRPDLE